MFRIPDYVAGRRADGVSPQSAPDDHAARRRAVTRLGGPAARAGRPRRQPQAGMPAGAAAIPQRPPTAEERRLAAHMARRRAEAARFAAESRFFDAQAEADAAEDEARAEASPGGSGLTGIVARNLALLKQTLLAGLPAEAAGDLRAAIEARFDAEAERRLDRAAKEEVQTGHAATRTRLAEMQDRLLQRIAREPERADELAAQGEGFTAVNTLPAAERTEWLAGWRARVAEVRDGRAADGARPQGGGAQLPAANGRATAIDREPRHPDAPGSVAGMASAAVSRQADGVRLDTDQAAGTRPSEPLPSKASATPAIAGDGRSEGEDHPPERRNMVAAVIDAPTVIKAWRTYEKEPTPANLRRVSEALIEAQADGGIPGGDRTPITPGEERDLAEVVLQAKGEARLDAIRRLAASLQERHGTAADLALRAIARHWADDARAAAFAAFLTGAMDTARIVVPEPSPEPDTPAGDAADANTQTDHANGDAVWNQPADAPPSEAMLANAEDAARRQRTSPQVRDANGNFLRGEPLGEGILSDAGEGFVDRDGAFHLVDRGRHVALLDPVSGRWLVFDRLLAHDTYTRGGILPFRRNDRTGKRKLALPDIVHGPIEAAKLPFDVYSGRVDPRSPEGRERIVDAAGSVTGSPVITRARPGSVATGLRRPPKRTGNALQHTADSGTDGAKDAPVKYNPITRLRAQFVLGQYKRNADRIFESASAADYFGPVWDRLPEHIRDFLAPRYPDFVGKAFEINVTDVTKKAGFRNNQQKHFKLPGGIGRSARIYDEATSEELELALRGLLVRPGKRNEKPTAIEAKVASSRPTRDQANADDYLTNEQESIAGVVVLRVPANRIKTKDLADVIERWLERRDGQSRPGGVPKQDVEQLIQQLRNQRGPDGKPLTIGQVSLVVLAATLPLLYPSETGDAERP